MIDFFSTRDSTQPEDRHAARMLAALIAAQLRAAAKFPHFQEIDHKRNYDHDALAAIEYLFARGSAFEDHIELLGSNAAVFRLALLEEREPTQEFTARQREAIRLRHEYWHKAHVQPQEETT